MLRFLSLSTLLLALAALTFSCRSKAEPERIRTVIDGFAQGGSYHIVIVADSSRSLLRRGIDSLLDALDESMSLYNPDSRLSRINRSETDTLDDFIAGCIRLGEQLSVESGGRFDLTVKPLTSAYGFGREEASQRINLDSLMQFVGYRKIAIEGNRLIKNHPGVQIDLNSIAQGASVDLLSRWLDGQGIDNYLVEVGGEIFARGLNARGAAWTVGIDKPVEGNFIPGADLQVRLGISDRGLATSGNYRKYYTDGAGRKIVHTVDARTGEPIVSNLLSATVIAPTSALADAYGTLCMVLGVEESLAMLKNHPELEGYLVWSDPAGDYRVSMTPGMEQMIIKNN